MPVKGGGYVDRNWIKRRNELTRRYVAKGCNEDKAKWVAERNMRLKGWTR